MKETMEYLASPQTQGWMFLIGLLVLAILGFAIGSTYHIRRFRYLKDQRQRRLDENEHTFGIVRRGIATTLGVKWDLPCPRSEILRAQWAEWIRWHASRGSLEVVTSSGFWLAVAINEFDQGGSQLFLPDGSPTIGFECQIKDGARHLQDAAVALTWLNSVPGIELPTKANEPSEPA